MSRGGVRPGAGRPRKLPPIAPDVQAGAANIGMSPLDYMLAVMRDPTADPARRDRMAQAAAPYVHAKPSAESPGKRAEAQRNAMTAERGSDWEALLQ